MQRLQRPSQQVESDVLEGGDADYFILSFAEELNATVVSNDRFKDRIKQYPALRRRVIKYMIVQGEVVFEKRTGRREKQRNERPGGYEPGARHPFEVRPSSSRAVHLDEVADEIVMESLSV